MGRLGIALLSVAALSGCLPQEEQPKVLISVQKTIAVPANGFSVSAYAVGRGDTQAEALEKLKLELDAARQAANDFASLETLAMEASEIVVEALPEPDCPYEGYRSEVRCPTIGYVATVGLDLKGTPALEAGNLISLLTEEVSGQVMLKQFYVVDEAAAKTQATAEAIEEARISAEQIAKASGLAVGALLEVRPRNTGGYYGTGEQYDDLLLGSGLGDREPRARITIDQPMADVSVDYLLTFTLEPVPASEE
jgi:hypothetical protein